MAFWSEWEGGLELIERAKLPNPNYSGYYGLATATHFLVHRDYQGAVQELRRMNYPEWIPGQLVYIATSSLAGNPEDALALWQALRSANPEIGHSTSGTGGHFPLFAPYD